MCVIHLDMYLTSYSTLLSGIISVFDIESSVSSAQCTVGVQRELRHEEATFSYIASLLRFNGTLLRYYGAETYSVIKSLIINKDFCPGRL